MFNKNYKKNNTILFKDETQEYSSKIHLNKRTLLNSFGERFDGKNDLIITSSFIRNEAAKEIGILLLESKKERKFDKNLFKKIKKTKVKELKSNNLLFKNEHKFIKYELNEKLKYKNKNDTLEKLSQEKFNILKKENKNNKKYFINLKKGLNFSDDDKEQKELSLKYAFQNIEASSLNNAKNMEIIDNFISKKISQDSFLETKIGKSIKANFDIIHKDNFLLDKSKKILNDENNVKDHLLKSKILYKKDISTELMKIKNKKISIIEKIEMIKEFRDKAIKDLKTTDKKVIVNKQNNNTILKLLFQFKYGFLSFIFIFSIFISKFLFIKPINIGRKYFENQYLLNKKLCELSPENSWDSIFYHKVYKNWKNIHDLYKEELNIQLRDLDKFNKEINSFRSNNQLVKNEKLTIKKRKKTGRKQTIINIKKSFNLFFKRKISFKALKNNIVENIFEWKDNNKKIKLNNKFFVLKWNSKSIKKQLFLQFKNFQKEGFNNAEYLIKSHPIERRIGFRFVVMGLNILFGGLGYLVGGQFKKGVSFLIFSILLYWFSLSLIFGQFGLGGNGIAGLSDFGKGVFRADSRYFIVEGVYSFVMAIILVLYIAIMGFSGYRLGLVIEKGARPNNWFISKKLLDKLYLPYILSIPAFIVVVFTVIAPLFAMFLLAFTNWGASANPIVGETFKWTGFENFKILFGSSGIGSKIASEFGKILGWTLIWGISTWLIGTILNIGITLLLNSERIKLVWLWRTIMILPMAIPGFIMILMFRLLIRGPSSVGAGDQGPLFDLIVSMGLWSSTLQDAIGNDVVHQTLKSVWFVRIFLILLSFWFGIGGGILYFSGIIQGISPTLYEAAKVDGAGPWKRHRTITLPHLFFIIAPTLIPAFIMALNNYSLIWLFNDGGPDFKGGSITGAGQSDIVLSWIYKLVKDPTQLDNSIGLTAVIGIIFGVISISIAAPGIFRSKMFREGSW